MKRFMWLVVALGLMFMTGCGEPSSPLEDFVITNGVLEEYIGPGGNVVIPRQVTKIGKEAFKEKFDVISITIPDTVTVIEDFAFSYCTGLENVTIPNSISSISNGAFLSCVSLKDVDIPYSVKSIGNWAFFSCDNLESITIPSSVTSLGGFTFASCDNLLYVEIPDSIKKIEIGAFYECTGLAALIIPEGITNIDDRAFYGCSNLNSIDLPESIKKIETTAFEGCDNLTIHGKENSYAERYAAENHILFSKESFDAYAVTSKTLNQINDKLLIYELFCELYDSTLPSKSRDLIKQKNDLFPTTDYKKVEDLIDKDIAYKHISKAKSQYTTTFMKFFGNVLDIDENDVYGTKYTMMHILDKEMNSFMVLYLGTLPKIFEKDDVNVVGIPLGMCSFDNIGGSRTEAVMIAASYVDNGPTEDVLAMCRTAFKAKISSDEVIEETIEGIIELANMSPFDPNTLLRSAQILLDYRVVRNNTLDSEWLLYNLASIGDAVIDLGKGKDYFEGISKGLAGINNSSKYSLSYEIDKLLEWGIPSWDYLSSSLGMTRAEIEKMAQDGRLPALAVVDLIFGNMRQRSDVMNKWVTNYFNTKE